METSGKTYTFYDFETTGLNHCFDQAIQAAFIETDAEFNIIARYSFNIKLRPDVVPALGALLTHQVPPSQLLQGTSEYEAMQQIHEIVNQPNTYTIGYNSLKFDDLFLRFGFYRNGLEPYTHQYHNGCQRLDLLPINVLYYLFDNNNPITYPTKANGSPSFKLDQLIAANALTKGKAHDAIVDVEATIELARRLRASSPELWQYALGYFDKTIDGKRCHAICNDTPNGTDLALLVNMNLKHTAGYQAPIYVLSITPKELHYLKLDDPKLGKLTQRNMAKSTLVKKKKLGEPGFVLPANRAQSEYFDEARQQLVQDNLNFIGENRPLIEQLYAHHQQSHYEPLMGLDVDAALYQEGFWTLEERIFFKGFHAQTGFAQKWGFVEETPPASTRSLALAKRILFRNFPEEVMQTPWRIEFVEFMAQSLYPSDGNSMYDYRQGKKLTAATLLPQMQQLLDTQMWQKKELFDDELSLIEQWQVYIEAQLNPLPPNSRNAA